MGMGTSAAYDDVIDVKHIKKFCPKTFKNFIKVMEENKTDLEDFANRKQYEDKINRKVEKAWVQLQADFKLATGLDLIIGYHEKEDRYDEVDGVYFAVEGMYQLTPAGEKHQKIIQRKFWTSWG